MELVLSGASMSAAEAHRLGLVSHVYKPEELLDKAVELATMIASKSRPLSIFAKEATLAAYNTTLQQGMMTERRLFHATFGLKDQREGMTAFAEKRKPQWSHQ